MPPWVSLRHYQALIAAYVSGHGYGHATRTGEVLRTLLRLAPDTPLTVVSSAPEWLFRQSIGAPFAYRPLECDVGLLQKDALVIDEAATARRWRTFAAGWDGLVESESRWLGVARARVVLGDVPPRAHPRRQRHGGPGGPRQQERHVSQRRAPRPAGHTPAG